MVNYLSAMHPSFRPQAFAWRVLKPKQKRRQGRGGLCLPKATLQLRPPQLPVYKPPTYSPQPLTLPLVFSPLGGLTPTKLQLAQCLLYPLAPRRLLRLQLCCTSNNKAVGVDGVMTELLKFGGPDAL